ncbi:glycosyl transferase group 1 [Gloeocapsa sp. PCC 7428]|uniref:glycosyltransferase family 4 protein n=1 Tax=Gloeocapsa sp. PCC 7428 TaxID=1173026 RepID=UPI0002A61862|nr:glycosyltransferase family 4 protein [Gloeocapsa sp. PCC 7428]AFZ29472.1 glycosyl transferase group 1 [Gloeocapsa sp. PCC 7428]
MKILFTISHLMTGGAQTFVIRLASGLAKDHAVYVYNCNFFPITDNSLIDRFPDTVKVISFFPPSSRTLLNRALSKVERWTAKIGRKIKFREDLRKLHFNYILKKLNIDLVNSHLYHADNFVVETLETASIPIIVTDHGDYKYVIEQQLSDRSSTDKIFNRINGIVVLSEDNATAISQYVSNHLPIKKIYNGVAEPQAVQYPVSGREKLKIPKEALVFGMVARGIPEKGWFELIQAFEQVMYSTQQEVHLILVGDSEYLQNLKASLANKAAKVHFVGYSADPNYWIECFDVGVLPTYFDGESLPYSIIEYLSFGKPAIATDMGGIPEMIKHNDQTAGFIINRQAGKADVSSLADAMLAYINNRSLREEHSQIAKQAFDKFNIENCVKSYELFFQQALKQHESSILP